MSFDILACNAWVAKTDRDVAKLVPVGAAPREDPGDAKDGLLVVIDELDAPIADAETPQSFAALKFANVAAASLS